MEDGVPSIASNIIFEGLDILELLSSDLDSVEHTDKFISRMKTKQDWWSNATRVQFGDADAIIVPAFEWEGGDVTLPLDQLTKLVTGWKYFLISNVS